MEQAFVGIDIQERRGCCFAAMGSDGILLGSGWFHDPEREVVQMARGLKEKYKVLVGIDAPRQPLPSPRKWFWDRKGHTWRPRSDQRGYGRHCEIVVSVHGIANPQWTPIEKEAPAWMVIGFNMFSALKDIVPSVYEVFPTASYSLLQGITDVRISIDFSSCRLGPKDILDAFVAAATVREFVQDRGTEVGGGDGLGTIVLPRPLPEPIIRGVLLWPEDHKDE
jgi:predicted nuclease with RNAse H fold